MNQDILSLEPQSLWNNFSKLNAVPRASKKEERVIQFMKDFGHSLGLETEVDHIGNVIIKKPATAGMENKQTVVLQSHLDMVHQKNNDTQFDFDTEGINMFIEDDWVKARGTTLGADNGIGVATIMAILESKEIAHPPLEALFTIDEETGMTGALELKGGLLNADIMLNLDTEDDNELTIGCAGGIDITAKGSYTLHETPGSNTFSIKLELKGLTGGHSGMDIHLGRGNSNKLMNRLLYTISKSFNYYLHSIDGGGLRNAIPRESSAHISFNKEEEVELLPKIHQIFDEIKKEYQTTDPDITLDINKTEIGSHHVDTDFFNQFLKACYTCHNGIYRMSPDVEDLVQTSNNMARVLIKDGVYEILCLTRSSVDSEKMDLVNSISLSFELIGASVTTSGAYPGWTPNPSSDIVKIMTKIYKERFNEMPHVNACHAGLECGILGTNYPQMDMISFGPNIRGAHSPDEKVQISSVQKYWGFLLDTLQQIPDKN